MLESNLNNDVLALQQILVQLSLASRKNLALDLGDFGLTVPQYSALRALHRNPDGFSMSALANACQQVKATMTGIVDRLSERNLVRRQPDPQDRRSQLVYLTSAGDQMIVEIEHTQRERLAQVLHLLSPGERKEMMRLLTIYLETIQRDPEFVIHPSIKK